MSCSNFTPHLTLPSRRVRLTLSTQRSSHLPPSLNVISLKKLNPSRPSFISVLIGILAANLFIIVMDILGPIEIFQQVVELIKKVKDRYDALQDNPTTAAKLIQTYQNLATRLNTIQENDKQTIARFPSHHADYFNGTISELNNNISQTVDQLTSEVRKLDDPVHAATHAMRSEALFCTLQQDVDRAKDIIDRIQETLALVSIRDTSSSSRPRFCPCNTAPPKTVDVVLDFHTVDEKGVLLTCEGQLLAAILTSPDGQSVGAVASGMGGVGKTCTLRAIAHRSDIRKRFPGGVYFISLGKDATVAKLIECLCDAVESAGGAALADELRRETVLAKVIRKVRDWFYDHICLFIIDDVWCSNGIKPDILEHLLILASNSGKGGGSRLVYSTRDDSLTSLGEIIPFKPRDRRGTTASNILLECARADDSELNDPVCEKAIQKILDMCAGLPVTLSIAGRGVRWRRNKSQGDGKEVWAAYWNAMKKSGILDLPADNYEKLGPSLLASLDFLDQDECNEVSGDSRLSYRKMHRGLCILEKQDWISAGELRYLWGLGNEDGAVRVIERMGRTGVADEEHRTHKGRLCVGLRLHDLVHDFAYREAEKHGELMMWHERLLDGKSKKGNASMREACWPVSLREEDYVYQNVCRLMQKAGRAEEVWSLLLSPKWIVKMIETSSILRLEEDIMMCTQSQNEEDRANALNTVGRAARLSVSDYFEAPDCVWFQLYARLFVTAQRCETTRGFLEGIEAAAPKPWLKPIRPCIRGASAALRCSFNVPGTVMDVQFLGEEEVAYGYEGHEKDSNVWIVKHRSGGERSEVRLHWETDSGIIKTNFVTSAELREGRVSSGRSVQNVSMPICRFCRGWRRVMCCWKRSTDGSSANSVQSSSADQNQFSNLPEPKWKGTITRLAIGNHGRRAITNDSYGLVRIWDTAAGLPQGEPDSMQREGVWFVAMSGNSRRAVALSLDRNIQMWNAETGQQEGEELEGYNSTCVSITRDGKFIVSGAHDRNIRVWNADMRRCLCTVRVGDIILDVAISDDGKSAVCGLWNSTVVLVDVENGAVHEEYKGHTSGVKCVDISGDGTCVVSGSRDNTVRVWDVETGRQLREFTGHTDDVHQVAISADKRRLISASLDKTVCLWDLEASTQTNILPTGHNIPILWVSICTDGKFVASCGNKERIGLWSIAIDNRAIWVPYIENVSVVFVSACEKRTFLGTAFGQVRMWNNGQDVSEFRLTEMTRPWHRELFLLKDAVDYAISKHRKDVVLLGQDNVLRLFRTEDHQPSLLSVPGAVISSVAISRHEGFLAFGSKEGNIHLWDRVEYEEMECGEPLVGHTNEVSCIAFNAESRGLQDCLVSGSKDKTVRVWDVPTRKQFGDTLVGHADWVMSVAMNFAQRFVVSGSRDMTVRVWDVHSEDRGCVVLRGHTGSVNSVAIDNRGARVVSGSEDKTVRVWDIEKGKQIGAPLYVSSNTVMHVEISHDGMCVMCRSKEGAVRWWNVECGNLMAVEVGGHMGEVYKIAESKDGKRIAVASRPTDKYRNWNPGGVFDSPQVQVWDLETVHCIHVTGEDAWNDVSRDYLGLDVSRDVFDVEPRDCHRVSMDDNRDQVGREADTGFRAVGRGIAFGEGSGKILANFEATVRSLDVDRENKVVAAGLGNGIVVILRIVE